MKSQDKLLLEIYKKKEKKKKPYHFQGTVIGENQTAYSSMKEKI